MKQYLIICFLFVNFFSLAAPVKWYEGSLVLNDKTVLSGQMSVEAMYGIVLYRSNETSLPELYTTHKIQSFYYYDAESNINRKFLCLELNTGVFHSLAFFEVVLVGDYSILRKQTRHALKPDDKLDYEYYVRKENDITLLSHFRAHVYPEMLESFREQLLLFVQHNKLNPAQPGEAIQIIAYYNRLSKYNTLAGNF